MDDATSEHYSMFFVAEEGTMSSFQGVQEVIEKHGLFASFYSDRGSHYWYTPKAGGKVDKQNLTCQIPADRHRCHYVKAKVTVLCYPNRQIAVMHGPRKLATYDSSGKEIKPNNSVVA